MKKKNVLIGLIFVLIALLIIVSEIGKAVGFLDGGLPVIRILGGAVMLAFLIYVIVRGRFSLIPIPLAALFLMFEGEIAVLVGKPDEDLFSAGAVIGITALLTVGLSLLFIGKTRDYINVNTNSMSDHTEYIDCGDAINRNFKNRLGVLTIRFANTESYTGDGMISIDNELGETDIYVPESWKLETRIDNSLGEVVIPDDVSDGPTLTICVKNRLGEVSINQHKTNMT